MNGPPLVPLMLIAAVITVMLIAGVAAVVLTAEPRVFVPVVLPAAIAAMLLRWRLGRQRTSARLR
jgi:hypothetical protein